MKIAIFKDPKYGYDRFVEFENEKYVGDEVRITDWVDVEFPPLPADAVIVAQVACLDRCIDEIADKFAKDMAKLKARKADLLALTDARDFSDSIDVDLPC